MTDLAQRLARLSPAQRELLEARLKHSPSIAQPVAIVGLACRLPGAKNLDEYWDLIRNQRCAFREIPPDRWDVDQFYDPDLDAPGKMATRHGAFLDDVAEFDAIFFGIAPREASRMDPQQRLLLEVSWEALEHAGIAPQGVAGTSVGVFVGIGGTDYSKLPSRFDNYLELIDAHVGTGNALSIASNRISYIMDFRGPSLSVDTACSSGLLAVHLAVGSLRSGECDLALAGGVNLILSPEVTIAFSKARMLSPTGHCRPFDSRADGYVRGEGCAILVLKRLPEAIRDGDHVFAVIRGSAANQDGRTSGITAPNSLSQQACIRAALAHAGIQASAVSYIEAHGTGTPLGDPIEMQSLNRIFRLEPEDGKPIYVGSVKANIGHTETVSGVAGLIKVVLMMQHGLIPAQADLEQLNPNIQLDGSRLRIPRQNIPWETAGRPRIAGVSSFGFGGTNTHVVLEQATATAPIIENESVPPRSKYLVAFSGKSAAAIPTLAAGYAATLEQLADDQLSDFCASINTGRSHFNHRCTVISGTRQQLLDQLSAVAKQEKANQVKRSEVHLASLPKLAFLFTGQGSQYPGMGQQLYQQLPLYRQIIDQCTEVLRDSRPHALTDVMFDPGLAKLIHETEYTQPALFAMEYALARVWQSWGVMPSFLLGHSVGEYVAACLADVFSLEQGLKLIAKRAELMQRMPPNGTMAVIFASRERVQEVLRDYRGQVVIATANGPENNVISGETAAVEEITGLFEKSGVGTQRLTVSHAFHSPLMDPMLDEFEAFAATLTYDRPKVPIVANRSGEVVTTASFDAAYWRDHLRNAVEFAKGMETLAEQQVHAFLEIGPAPALLGMGRRCIPTSEAAWISSLRKGRDDWETVLTALSDLYLLGTPIDWKGFDRPWPRRRIVLPSYPFRRSRHWMEGQRSRFGGVRGESVHPLLGSVLRLALPSALYETRVSRDSTSYLRDHIVQGSCIVPAAAYVEQGFALAKIHCGAGSHAIEDVSVQRGLFLPVEGYRQVQITVSPESGGQAPFHVYSIGSDVADDPHPQWQLHVSGTIVHSGTLSSELPTLPFDEADFVRRIVRQESREEFYSMLRERNLSYGPKFQTLGTIARTHAQARAELCLPDSVRNELAQYHLHPALADGIFQAAAGVIPLESDGSYSPFTYIPTRIARIRIWGDPSLGTHVLACRTSAESTPSPEAVEADLFLVGADRQILVEVRGLHLIRAGRALASTAQSIQDWFYQLEWVEQTVETPTESSLKDIKILLFEDQSGVANAVAQEVLAAGGAVARVREGSAFEAEALSFRIRPTAKSDYEKLAAQLKLQEWTPTHVIHFWSLDTTHPEEGGANALLQARELNLTSPLYAVQMCVTDLPKPPALRLVTCQAQHVHDDIRRTNVQQAPLWGFGRVAALEHPELILRLIDLEADTDLNAILATLVPDLLQTDDESQLAYRQGRRYAARLRRIADEPATGKGDQTLQIPQDGDFRLRVYQPGSIDGLRYERFSPPPLQANQVALDVRATGLNFSDVLKALGLYPGIKDVVVPLGIECSGIVTAVGPDVTRFRVGDAVLGVVPYGFASRAITAEYALVKKPAQIDFEQAATIPIVYLTAYHALCRLARLQRGERILIHAGAGGVGLAAIQIAQYLGAEVFTTAGSDEKREYLRQLGVQHVMNSRNLDFVDQVLEATDRQGVDVVLNSLSGDALTKSLSLLRAYGRFLEIGKTDIYSNSMIGLLPFQDNLSYFAIDLDRILRQRPDYIRELFAEVMQHFEEGHFRPIPYTYFAAEDVLAGFRYMAQRKNIGKVVISMSERGEPRRPEWAIRADGTYLITGGYGALGGHMGDWLVEQGARYLALLSRRVPENAREKTARWRGAGVKIADLSGDVARMESLASALALLPMEFPPIVGVIHAAGALADGLIMRMDAEQLSIPLESKVQGTWNLHECFTNMPLDAFIEFSSVASLLGSPGQGNYAAGNAFLDAMAAYRTSRRENVLCINWGPWSGSGMAVEAGRDRNLAHRGMNLLPPRQALEAVSRLSQQRVSRAAVMSVSWPELLAAGTTIPSILKEFASAVEPTESTDSAEDLALRQSLQAASLEERQVRLRDYLVDQLAQITGLKPDEIDVHVPLNTMGLDSLMAIELKNKIEKRLKIVIPMAAFLHEPSVSSLAGHAANCFEQ